VNKHAKSPTGESVGDFALNTVATHAYSFLFTHSVVREQNHEKDKQNKNKKVGISVITHLISPFRVADTHYVKGKVDDCTSV